MCNQVFASFPRCTLTQVCLQVEILYVSLEPEFEKCIFEFEFLNLNNCIEKLNLNNLKLNLLVWIWILINLKLNVIQLLWNCIWSSLKTQLSEYFHIQFSQFKFNSGRNITLSSASLYKPVNGAFGNASTCWKLIPFSAEYFWEFLCNFRKKLDPYTIQ